MDNGRDWDQWVADVKKNGISYTWEILRNSFLMRMGVNIKDKAENVVVTGCAAHTQSEVTKVNFSLLDTLGVDHTVLQKEYCCGVPLIHYQSISGKDHSIADAAAREFIGLNIEAARQKGARRILYLCLWCAYVARHHYPDCDVTQLYYLDYLDEAICQRKMRLAQPQTVAYFSGCHKQRLNWTTDGKPDHNWAAHRRWLDNIENLRVIDVKPYCCSDKADLILQQAIDSGATAVVTPCKPCYSTLLRSNSGAISVKHINDLLLEALGGKQ